MGGTKWILELPDPISRVGCKEQDIDWKEVGYEIREKLAANKVRIVHCEIDPRLDHKTLSESLAERDEQFDLTIVQKNRCCAKH